LDNGIHGQISGFYGSIQPFSQGQKVRTWLSTMSMGEQQEFERQILIMFGAL